MLAGLAGLLQQIAVIQLAGADALESGEDTALLARLAGQMPAETVQLMYQIAVLGRRDLDLAPDPRTGFEMTLLRVLAFDQADSPAATMTSSAAAPPIFSASTVAPTPRRPAV